MYCTVKEVKDYLDFSDVDADDKLLEKLIKRAQKYIESDTRRIFECDENSSRYLESDAIDDDDPYLLHLEQDLCGVDFIKNADSTSDPETIPSTEWWLTDAAGKRKPNPPYHAVRLMQDSSYAWDFDTDAWVEISGHWAFCEEAPEDIKQACIELVVMYYRSTISNAGEDRAITTPDGFTLHPKKIPVSVRDVLDHYRRPW